MPITTMTEEIAGALATPGGGAPFPASVRGHAALPSGFPVSALATASVGAAAAELAAFIDQDAPPAASVDAALASAWFGMTLSPEGWSLPSLFDAFTGDYRAKDGWIRPHTIAPRHREAALAVLGPASDRAALAEGAGGWEAEALEAAVTAAGGAAAAMRSLDAWSSHPQGRSLASVPLIAWDRLGAEDGRDAQTPRGRPLQGIKVLDLTRVLAGPVATRFLAAFGAEVLRIDPPFWDEPGIVPEVTPGKRCARLDLTQREDRAVFERLLREADILVHGLRPGALEGLGYGEDARGALAPSLREASLCAYGWSGPWAGRRGFDSLVQMACGIADHGARVGGTERPVPLPVQALDHATGYLVAAAALRALRLRREGVRLRARLSLARTARLLTAQPGSSVDGSPLGELPLEPEETFWGPAKRIAFPVVIEGTAPRFALPAGPLRRHEARFGKNGE